MEYRNIVLVGMMGTGKSSVGQALASRLNWVYEDTDAATERAQGMSITRMFAELGEPFFRKAESETIERTLQGRHQVVATGGGAVLAEQNRILMQRSGLVVALKASAETIIERVRSDQSRPLLQGGVEERVRHIMESRKHAYDFADLHVETDGKSVGQIVDEICSRLEQERA
ncbi:shikimate kinase [Paenibacillus tyrfis]|uniref:Shikimate kinase n=1 Tax=Paenibacillus tyrfis TaxID=1501230 RepID=A0A081P9I8_9BACL|nr:shikimate kinase [Paenibacillus tyrfis]KEQ27361.1 shikimate kinase [Paenibacillus tyrfis]